MHTADYDEISDDQMRQDDNYEKKSHFSHESRQ